MNTYILIVEDNPSDAAIAESVCHKLSRPSISVSDGFAALDLIHDEDLEIELLILDIEMPKMPGLELLRRLKNTVKGKDIPVIIMSGRKENSDIRRAIRLGADDYVVKPIDAIAFEEKIEKCVNSTPQGWKECEIPSTDNLSRGVHVEKVTIERMSEVGGEVILSRHVEVGDFYSFISDPLGTSPVNCRIEEISKIGENSFRARVMFVGLTEERRRKMRSICLNIWRKYHSKIGKLA